MHCTLRFNVRKQNSNLSVTKRKMKKNVEQVLSSSLFQHIVCYFRYMYHIHVRHEQYGSFCQYSQRRNTYTSKWCFRNIMYSFIALWKCEFFSDKILPNLTKLQLFCALLFGLHVSNEVEENFRVTQTEQMSGKEEHDLLDLKLIWSK